MQYEISIRITFPEIISRVLKLEKDRFVSEFGSVYKSEPHITLYLDRYTREGFPKLLHDLQTLRVQPFTISLLKPTITREEERHRNLYIMDVSDKERIRQLHTEVSEIAIRYRSPLLREKTRQQLEKQGIYTDGTRESVKSVPVASVFDPHITLGEVGLDDPQPNLTDIRERLKQLEGENIDVSSIIVFFYGKESNEKKMKLIDEVAVPFHISD